MSKEQWEWIADYEGYYQVSTHGRIRSVTRIVVDKNGCQKPYRGRIMKQFPHPHLYPMCNLQKSGQSTLVRVHTLVLETFIGPAPDGYEAHHKSGNRTDNRIENLEWVPIPEHKREHRIGEKNPSSKLTKEQVLEIYARAGSETHGAIATSYGVERSTVTQILMGRTWSHLYQEMNP